MKKSRHISFMTNIYLQYISREHFLVCCSLLSKPLIDYLDDKLSIKLWIAFVALFFLLYKIWNERRRKWKNEKNWRKNTTRTQDGFLHYSSFFQPLSIMLPSKFNSIIKHSGSTRKIVHYSCSSPLPPASSFSFLLYCFWALSSNRQKDSFTYASCAQLKLYKKKMCKNRNGK